MRTNIPGAMRLLRHRRRWRQHDLGTRAGLSRDAVSRAETGRLSGMTLGSLDRLTRTLDATLVVELRWQGAALDRLGDRLHARLQESTAARLTAAGWLTRAEVSFNHYGDRGSCDLVAFHPASRALLVIEVKTRVGNLQDLLHRLDVKARLGRVLAADLSWPVPSATSRAVVLLEGRSSRVIVTRHPQLFAPFTLRGRRAHAWLRAPGVRPASLLWFEKSSDSDERRTIEGERVRTAVREGGAPQQTGSDANKTDNAALA